MELSEDILGREADKLLNGGIILRYFSRDKTAPKATNTTETMTAAPSSSMPGTPAAAPESLVVVTSMTWSCIRSSLVAMVKKP